MVPSKSGHNMQSQDGGAHEKIHSYYSDFVLEEINSFILSTVNLLGVIVEREITQPRISFVGLADNLEDDAKYDPESKTIIINLNALFRNEEDKSVFNPYLKIAIAHELTHYLTDVLHEKAFEWRNIERNGAGPETLLFYISDEGSRCEFIAGLLSGSINTRKGLHRLIDDIGELGYNEQAGEIFIDIFRMLKKGGDVNKALYDYIRLRENALGDHLYIYGMIVSSIMLIGNGLESDPEAAERTTIHDLLVTPLEDIISKASGIVIDRRVDNAYGTIYYKVLKELEEEQKMRENEQQREREERIRRMKALQDVIKTKRLKGTYDITAATSMLKNGALKGAYRSSKGNKKEKLKR
jgi:hypothetical protein